ncbi:MAG: 4Fe-4S binding protein [Usitatibacter sp.]
MTEGLEVTAPAGAENAGSDIRDEMFTLESWGWSANPDECAPKILALESLMNLAPPQAVASVSYQSRGNVLVVAGSEAPRARAAAARLVTHLQVTLLLPEGAAASDPYPTWTGQVEKLAGYLGEFTASIAGLRAPGQLASAQPVPAKFDLVLDFSRVPLFGMRQPPQGYFIAPSDEGALEAVLAELRESVGEFDKPRFFTYRENICAHSRSAVEGCSACIEICSTQAISPAGDKVKVDPHLCMGCGACATVCPSGAMGYQYPRVADRGAQMKQLLTTYRVALGTGPCIVFHNGTDGRELLAAAAASGSGLPANALPLEAWHVASTGLDLLLPAIAFGATSVAVLSAGSEDAQYLAALRHQMAIGQAILRQLGYAGTHFTVIEASTPGQLTAAFEALAPAAAPAVPASFMLGNDKRTAIEFAVDHLLKHAPSPVDEIALPEGSLFGQVLVDQAKCTMCMACVGACPESALMDGVDKPLIKFLERNCVQCGLCEATCPEGAISLSARLLLTPAVREARVLNETQPFHCVRCSKPFGTRQMVDAMMGRLMGHSMFAQGDAIKRLQMCADCRVVDMMSATNEVSVLRLGNDS